LRGKRKRKDVAEFSVHLADNIIELHRQLKMQTYFHDDYEYFKINDPKPRDIHKASVKDRLVHRALYRILSPFFDQKFIHDSYSCRFNKASYKAMERFKVFVRKVSKNHTQTCWVLKCDIRKFFASIDHNILKLILTKHIKDQDVLWLLSQIVDSFCTTGKKGVGLPLGNLTSQILVNVYMNEFDQFMKHKLKTRYYIRYADDFVILLDDRTLLENTLIHIRTFLKNNLSLDLHPDKVSITTIASDIDFLGWVHFPKHQVLRTTTKRRMIRNLQKNKDNPAIVQSYRGLLRHGATYKMRKRLGLL
jgi:retron-type reverse transcriptase